MSDTIAIQKVSTSQSLPNDSLMIKWVTQALDTQHNSAELTLRIVDEAEGQALNKEWRKKDYATNVLSFAVGEPMEHAPNLLGDIVICAPIVEQEANEQGKSLEAHWAHLITHGVLHLQGYEHESDEDASIMESKEILILEKNGYANPYEMELQP